MLARQCGFSDRARPRQEDVAKTRWKIRSTARVCNAGSNARSMFAAETSSRHIPDRRRGFPRNDLPSGVPSFVQVAIAQRCVIA